MSRCPCGTEFIPAKRHPNQIFCSKQCKQRKNNKDGRAAQRAWARCNPDRVRGYAKAYRAKNPEKTREMHRFRLYNVTPDMFSKRFQEQAGKCALCKSPLNDDIAIDHDHRCCQGERSCGKCVRGLLHTACNRGIGVFREDPLLCRMAADYLEGGAEWNR